MQPNYFNCLLLSHQGVLILKDGQRTFVHYRYLNLKQNVFFACLVKLNYINWAAAVNSGLTINEHQPTFIRLKSHNVQPHSNTLLNDVTWLALMCLLSNKAVNNVFSQFIII